MTGTNALVTWLSLVMLWIEEELNVANQAAQTEQKTTLADELVTASSRVQVEI